MFDDNPNNNIKQKHSVTMLTTISFKSQDDNMFRYSSSMQQDKYKQLTQEKEKCNKVFILKFSGKKVVIFHLKITHEI